jgi:hypothetical protein
MVQSPIKACLAGLMPSSEEETEAEEDADADEEEEDLELFNLRSPPPLPASVLERKAVARTIDAIANFMVDVI